MHNCSRSMCTNIQMYEYTCYSATCFSQSFIVIKHVRREITISQQFNGECENHLGNQPGLASMKQGNSSISSMFMIFPCNSPFTLIGFSSQSPSRFCHYQTPTASNLRPVPQEHEYLKTPPMTPHKQWWFSVYELHRSLNKV